MNITELNILKITKRTFLLCIYFSSFVFAHNAQATNCELTNKYSWNLNENIPFAGSGLSTVGEDLSIGETIYSSTHSKSKGMYVYYECDDTDTAIVYSRIDAISTPYGAPIVSGGKAIYPTNVPGIGVTFEIETVESLGTSFPHTWEDSLNVSLNSIVTLNPLKNLSFKLVKTGIINTSDTQQVLASSFPTFRISIGAKAPTPDEKIVTTINFNGSITLHTKTCQISTPQISVDLGTHDIAEFKKPGSGTAWEDFDIRLVNCPPFYGYSDYKVSSSGKESGTVTPNKINFGFQSSYGTVQNNPRLANIENTPNSASGIGIELSQKNESTSIMLDGSSGFDLQNLNTDDNATYTIPMRARYVQYDSHVKGGLANGAVVFTVTYQ
ncbi:fimbrial protein [Serratia fonticola]|uniref:fimbrial protein n=1 Tax=Serratia fonticola TaxID=47917 RepID=UPI0034C5CF9C